MANTKITDLTAYGDPTSTDVLPIVDVGADVTKKVSIADLLKNAGFGTEALPGIAFDDDPNTGISRPDADQLAISTAGTERLRITSDGELGLGTNNPSSLLHVQTGSSGSVQIGADGTSQSASKIFNPVDTIKLESTASDVILSSGRHFLFEDETGTAFGRWASNGRLGIGVTVPESALEIDAAAAVPPFIAKINTSEAVRIDSDGRFLIGTPTPLGQNELVQIARSDTGDHFGIFSFDATAGGQPAEVNLSRSKSDTIGTGAALAADDALGAINFRGHDADNFSLAASITAAADGEFGTSGDTTDSPGRLVFSTTADGDGAPTPRMMIKSTGIINIANTPVYADNAAAKTGGLVDGDVYRTSTGDLKIVYT